MIGDHIVDGDMAIIHKQPTVAAHEIAAVLVGNEVTLKPVVVRAGRAELRPSNPALKPIVASAEEVKILGKMVGLVRK
jgi:repressor LexA